MGIGANDNIDKLVQKYSDKTTVLSGLQNMPVKVSCLDNYYDIAEDLQGNNYKDLKQKYTSLTEQRESLKKQPLKNKKKLETIKQQLQDLVNPN